MAARTSAKQEAQPGSTLLVIHNFAARSGDELSLAKGDRLELIERDDEFGDGWFLGKHNVTGLVGLFPEVYTTVAPKTTQNNVVHQRRDSEGLPKVFRTADESNTTNPIVQRHASTSAVPVTRTSFELPATTPATQPALRTSLPATASSRTDPGSIASPVMHETLSVIDEHMNDMNTPPGSFTASKRNSTGMRYSYITGHETDEEENPLHTEDEVLTWSPERVAEYLEDEGVEKAHCDVFKEQEISGEVLLAMEQSSLFLKEFALGSVGRRLKTWHKIRALQTEVRQGQAVNRVPEISDDGTGTDAASVVDIDTAAGAALPRALDTTRQSMEVRGTTDVASQGSSAPAVNGVVSPLQALTSNVAPEDGWKQSAQAMREAQISRRLSVRQSASGAAPVGGSLDNTGREGYRKQPSLDVSWRMGEAQTNGTGAAHTHTMGADTALGQALQRNMSPPSPPKSPPVDISDSTIIFADLPAENDAERQNSLPKEPSISTVSTQTSRNDSKRRSTLASGITSQDSYRDSVSPTISQGIMGALNSVGSSLRSSTSPQVRRKPTHEAQASMNPIVTKLDHSASSDALATNARTTAGAGQRASISPKIPFFSKSKAGGLRATSDAVTKSERSTASPTRNIDSASLTRTGSTTPSTETRSFELQKSEAQLRASMAAGGNLQPPPANQRRVGTKSKKATSAYTRGLERKPPAEQIQGSDYSGWMKKKSGSLMTTWKTRLFVLKGRRLSYYYSDGDQEEKGLIDISFHRVLPAHNETLTGLHATLTGATGSPSSPQDTRTETAAQRDLKEKPVINEPNDGMFIFKLVPPKSGLSKAVNFTKPIVHYFAVNSRQEGRLWMAALMKATIDRDEDLLVTTTYNQKTISLAKARARRERPPALKDDAGEPAELDGAVDTGLGLGIGGMADEEHTRAGAERERSADETASMAPSTTAPSTAATGVESVVEKDSGVAA